MTTEDKQRLLLLGYAKDRHKYNESFFEFFKDAWAAVDPNTKLKVSWHIKYQCFIAQLIIDRIVSGQKATYQDVLINVPPRSAKSWIFNVALPVYAWTKKPSLPIITASYSMVLGLGFARKSQQIINSNWFQYRYSDIVKIGLAEGGRENQQETETSEAGVRFVASTGSTITGKGFLLGVLDDPLNGEESKQQIALDANIRFYDEFYDTRRNDPEVATSITIMQRLAENDIAGHLKEKNEGNKSFLHINLPVLADGTEKVPLLDQFLLKHPEEAGNVYKDGYLFKERFGDDFINKQKRKGTIFFQTQYMQNPLPTDGLLFKRDWFPKISLEEYLKLERTYNLKRTFVTDTAYTDKSHNDPTAIAAYSSHEGICYLINYKTEHVDSANLSTFIEEYVNRNGYDKRKSMVTIEPKGSGMVVISLLKKLTNLNVIPYKYPPSAKVNINMSKQIRAEAIVAMVEANKLIIVEGSWNEAYLQQMVTFPLAKHDEAVDISVMAILRSHYIDSRYKKFSLKRTNTDT